MRGVFILLSQDVLKCRHAIDHFIGKRACHDDLETVRTGVRDRLGNEFVANMLAPQFFVDDCVVDRYLTGGGDEIIEFGRSPTVDLDGESTFPAFCFVPDLHHL